MLKGKYPCIISASACGILLATFLIPVLFYTYSGILGKTLMPLDIATFILSVLAAFSQFTALLCPVRPLPFPLPYGPLLS